MRRLDHPLQFSASQPLSRSAVLKVPLRAGAPPLMYVTSLPIDLCVEPLGPLVGAKRAARITNRLGGPAGNGAPVALANGIRCGVIGVQAPGLGVAWSRKLANDLGLVPYVSARRGDCLGLSVISPTDRPGEKEIASQRCRPITLTDISAAGLAALRAAEGLVIGPMAVAHPEIPTTIIRLAQLAPNAYRALLPHPSLVCHPMFAEVARQFDYVQMNLAEARLTGSPDASVDAIVPRLHDLLAGDVEFAITNGGALGYLWADHHPWAIKPFHVEIMEDVGGGDIFCSAWVVARQFFHLRAKPALRFALIAAAAGMRRLGAWPIVQGKGGCQAARPRSRTVVFPAP